MAGELCKLIKCRPARQASRSQTPDNTPRRLAAPPVQVRSCTLDTWLPGQVAFMAHTGNEVANRYWEARAEGGQGAGAKPAFSNLAGVCVGGGVGGGGGASPCLLLLLLRLPLARCCRAFALRRPPEPLLLVCWRCSLLVL